MIKHLSSIGVIALSFLTNAMADNNGTKGDAHYRVFIADYDKPYVHAFDLNKPSKQWTFDINSKAVLYPVADGSAIAAIQPEHNQINFITSGIHLYSHGQHSDIDVSDPMMIDDTINGPYPFHLVEHDNQVAINFDQGGYASVINNADLKKGDIKYARVQQNTAHHGIVIPWNGDWLTSVASTAEQPKETAPPRVGLQKTQANGEFIGALEKCTNLHGEAFSGDYLAVGCQEGVLTVKHEGKQSVYNMLPYPKRMPEGEMAGHFLGAHSMQIFLGSYGKKGVVIIDPVDVPNMTYVELPFRRIDFILDTINPSKAYILTENGKINRLNLLTGQIDNSLRVTQPYSMDGDWNAPRPRLALAGDQLLITDPNEGVIHRVNTDSFSVMSQIKVEGKPFNITVVGGSGLQH